MEYLEINKQAWDERTQVHTESEFYDVPGFLQGKSSLQSIESAELEVANKSLLHLQCHFGLDTLSWARKGAKVTGVDLSSKAIEQAKSLAQQAGLESNFICSDVYSVAEHIDEQFDIVFTSYGAIIWLPDLDQWAKTIAARLKSGGQFYMVEFHPLQALLDGYNYFPQAEPDVEQEATYTENADDTQYTSVSWPHSLSEVINALIGAGLKIERLNEFDFSPYDCFAGLKEASQGRFVLLHQGQKVPLVYSVLATKA